MDAPQIVVLPEHDPFAVARRARRRKLAIVVAVVVAGALVVGAVVLGRRVLRAEPVGPPPLDAALLATRWIFPADPATGYERLASPFLDGVGYDSVALGLDGTLAVGLRPRGRGPHVLVWRDRAVKLHAVDAGRVTALAFDPDGTLWAGASDGRVARIGARGVEGDWITASAGSAVEALVFSTDSPAAAVLIAGGRVFAAERPFRAGKLREVTMPRRARIRKVAYTSSGDLALGGDAGAFFVADGDDWTERSLPTGGNVSAIGRDAGGDLLVAQSNGHIWRYEGTWARIGQAPSAPVVIGEGRGRGIVAVGSDGRVFATLGRDELSEAPGYERPGVLAVFAGAIAGDDVALLSSTNLLVLGDALFDASADGVAQPPGTTPRSGCTPLGPPETGAPALATPLLRCGDTLSVLGARALEPAPTMRIGAASVPSTAWARALEEQDPFTHTLDGAPVRVRTTATLLTFEKWDPARQAWAPLALYDASMLGEATNASFSYERGGADLWVLSTSMTLHHARFDSARGEATAFTPIVVEPELGPHLGCGPDMPCSATVWALGSGVAVVAPRRGGASLAIVRVDVATPHQVEPLTLPGVRDDEYLGPRMFRSGQRLLLARTGWLVLIEKVGPPRTLQVPAGVEPALDDLDGLVATSARGVLAVPATRDSIPTLLLCDTDRCRERALPRDLGLSAARFTPDERLIVRDSMGVVGTLPSTW